MKKIILFILIGYSISICSQKIRIEKKYQNCAYNSLKDKGRFLKKQIKQYELYLVKNGYLTDSTALSYYKLFNSFSKRKKYPSVYEYSFFDSIKINSIETKKVFPSNKKCWEKLEGHQDYEIFIGKIKYAILVSNKEIHKTLKAYSEVLKPEDFYLDFYKIQTLIFIQLLNF